MPQNTPSGSDVRIYWNSLPVAYATNCTFQFNREFIEIAPTSVDDAGFKRFVPRTLSGTMTVNALYTEGILNKETLQSTFADFLSGAELTIMWRSDNAQYKGGARVQSISANSAAGQTPNWSATFIMSGEYSFVDTSG